MKDLSYYQKQQAFFYTVVVILLSFAFCSYFFIDRALAFEMLHLDTPKVDQIFSFVTNFGKGNIWVVILAALYLICRWFHLQKKWQSPCLYLLTSILIAGFICDGLKYLLGRNRPFLFFTQHMYGFHFFQTHFLMVSFPSGHSTVIAAAMMGFYLLKPKLWPWCLGMISLVGFSRLILTDHFLSDVLVGFCLGAIVARVCFLFFVKKGYLA